MQCRHLTPLVHTSLRQEHFDMLMESSSNSSSISQGVHGTGDELDIEQTEEPMVESFPEPAAAAAPKPHTAKDALASLTSMSGMGFHVPKLQLPSLGRRLRSPRGSPRFVDAAAQPSSAPAHQAQAHVSPFSI